jgi:hypothetical protein
MPPASNRRSPSYSAKSFSRGGPDANRTSPRCPRTTTPQTPPQPTPSPPSTTKNAPAIPNGRDAQQSVSSPGNDYADRLRRGRADLLIIPREVFVAYREFPHQFLFQARAVGSPRPPSSTLTACAIPPSAPSRTRTSGSPRSWLGPTVRCCSPGAPPTTAWAKSWCSPPTGCATRVRHRIAARRRPSNERSLDRDFELGL